MIPSDVILEPGTIDVWRVPLHLPEDLDVHLTIAEQNSRAKAVRDDIPRRFRAARAALRLLLAHYLGEGIAPSQVPIAVETGGKPFIPTELHADGLRFNVSHSHELALVAVTRGREVGVDVEHLQPRDNIPRLAKRFFAPPERNAVLEVANVEQRALLFYQTWTRKESWVKATGTGLRFSTRRFVVSMECERAALLEIDGKPVPEGEWTMQPLVLGGEYVGTVAASGMGWRVRGYDFPSAGPSKNIASP